jgi:hypothetical protein
MFMDRRTFVTGLAAALPLGLISGDGTFAQSGQRIRSIVVDTKPLEARGASGAAAVLRPQLQASLQRQFAGRLGGAGPVLVVRVQTLMLGAFAGPSGGTLGMSSSDYMEGDVTFGAEKFPLMVTQDSSAGGAWYLPDNQQRRLRALTDQFAGWVARRV